MFSGWGRDREGLGVILISEGVILPVLTPFIARKFSLQLVLILDDNS